MKQKSVRGVRKGGKKSMAVIQQQKKHDPFPPRWWRSKGKELTDRGDDRAWLDW